VTTLALAAFGIAFVVSVGGTPLARRLALRYRILDRPRPGKSHWIPTPYLGGLAIAVGFALAALGTGAWRALGAISAGALILAIVGVTDDIKDVAVFTRLTMQGLAAALVVASGVHFRLTGIGAVDLPLSILWIVGITNAFNLLDNMNGLSAGAAALAAASYMTLAIFGGQHLVAALAAAVLGAVLGFLPYNFPRARIFMGDGGSLVLGFLLATIALKLRLPVGHLQSFVAKVGVVGLAVVDTSFVVITRLRERRSVFRGGTDHLSHRLVGLGLSRTGAVGSLLGVAAFFGVLGVMGGRGAIPAAVVMLVTAGGIAGALWLFRGNAGPVIVVAEQEEPEPQLRASVEGWW